MNARLFRTAALGAVFSSSILWAGADASAEAIADSGAFGLSSLGSQDILVTNSRADLLKMDADGERVVSLGIKAWPDTASWSPDGASIAYSWLSDAGLSEIHVVKADGSDKRRLTRLGGARDPDYSPDGSRIVFVKDDDIYVMNADGTGLRLLISVDADNARGPTWSPDGSRIAFSTWYDGGLFVMNSDGSNVTQILEGDIRTTQWSPDGKRILYYDRDYCGIYTIDVDGSGLVRLTDRCVNGAAWSPDGSRIVYAGKNGSIHMMAADGSRHVALTAETADPLSAYGFPAWRKPAAPRDVPFFRLLIERRVAGRSRIFSTRADGSDEMPLTFGPGNDTGAVWSPDRTRIAFISDRDGRRSLYVMRADGSDVHKLGDDRRGEYQEPTWTPDGSQLVVEIDDGVQTDLHAVSASDGSHRNITRTAAISEYSPSVAPGGTVVFHSDEPDRWFVRDLYTIHLDGTGRRRLTTTPYAGWTVVGHQYPVWSPDGQFIACSTLRPGKEMQVIVMRADGTGERFVDGATPGYQYAPVWSREGDHLAYTHRPRGAGTTHVNIVRIDGAHVFTLPDAKVSAWSE